MSVAIAVTSGKGGTGKTSVTAGVGACLAALGHTVLCVDMDVGLRNLDLVLGMSDRALMDFSDVIEGRCPLERAAASHGRISNLFLLTAPLTPPGPAADGPGMAAFLAQAKGRYDYVLLDAPAGLGAGFRRAACAADRAVVVSTTEPSALRDAQHTVAKLSRTLPRLHLVVNRVQPKLLRKVHTDLDQVMDATGLPLLGVVPEDPRVILSASRGEALVLGGPGPAATACLNIAKRLTGQRIPLMKLR